VYNKAVLEVEIRRACVHSLAQTLDGKSKPLKTCITALFPLKT